MNIQYTDQFLLDAYTGQSGFADGSYLVQHPRESTEKFDRRRHLATYPNYTRKVVNTYLSHLFQRPARRESQMDVWELFSENADGAGAAIEKVMRRATRLAMLVGTVALVVDRPQGTPRNRAEEAGLRPYVAIRMPDSISNVVLDEFGDLASITFAEQISARQWDIAMGNSTSGGIPVVAAGGISGNDGMWRTLFRTYRTDGWILSADKEGDMVIDHGFYSLGGVPVAFLHSTEVLLPGVWRAQSWAWDVAVENWNIYQLYSELREILRAQTFSILTFPVADPEEAKQIATNASGLTASPEGALVYNPAGGGSPQFISPNGENARIYMDELMASIERLYKQANLEFISGAAESSGIALAFRFQEANRTISDLASMAEQAEREVATWVCRWVGQEFDGTIVYPSDFSVQDLQTEMKVALDSVTLGISPTFEGALKKKMARSILGAGTSHELLNEIDKEIDDKVQDEQDVYRKRLLAEAQLPLQDQGSDGSVDQEQMNASQVGMAQGTVAVSRPNGPNGPNGPN